MECVHDLKHPSNPLEEVRIKAPSRTEPDHQLRRHLSLSVLLSQCQFSNGFCGDSGQGNGHVCGRKA